MNNNNHGPNTENGQCIEQLQNLTHLGINTIISSSTNGEYSPAAETGDLGQDNGFDFEGLRLRQDFPNLMDIRRLLTTVQVRKPGRQEFIRVHSEWYYLTAVIEAEETREIYVVHQDLREELSNEIVHKVFFTVVSRQGAVFLWPIKLPNELGQLDTWNRSAMEAAHYAKSHWVRVSSNSSGKVYDVIEAKSFADEPIWPKEGFEKILGIAFKGRIINSMDHPVLRQLRGE